MPGGKLINWNAGSRRRVCLAGVLLASCLALAACGPRGLVRSDLAGGEQGGPKRVLVVPADFVITEVTFGKTEERVVPAERKAAATWLQHVRELGSTQGAFEVADFQRLSAEQQELVLQHRALLATMVSQMLLVKEGAVDAWSTKLKYFDYTLGPGLADMAREQGVDTAIFIVGKDKVRSTSRKVLDAITTVLPLGESLSSQPAAVVSAVVDLRSGDVLLFDSDMASRKALTDSDDVKAMAQAVLSDFRKTLKPREGAR
jgi:hypothetical protein